MIFISLISCDYLSVYVYVGFAEIYLRFSRDCGRIMGTVLRSCPLVDFGVRDVTLLIFRVLITRLFRKFEMLFFEPHIIRRDRPLVGKSK